MRDLLRASDVLQTVASGVKYAGIIITLGQLSSRAALSSDTCVFAIVKAQHAVLH